MSKNIQNRIAKASGTDEVVRNDRISTEIGKVVPFPMQMAIVMNALLHLYKKMEELHGAEFMSAEFSEYQELRKAVKAQADADREVKE